jgi:hypothetical protein
MMQQRTQADIVRKKTGRRAPSKAVACRRNKTHLKKGNILPRCTHKAERLDSKSIQQSDDPIGQVCIVQ